MSVVIDLSKQIKPKVVEPQKPIKPPEKISFEAELVVANKLHAVGKRLQKTILDNLGKNLPIDIAIPKAFTSNIISSIDRNPNALMCMTKIREKIHIY